LTGSQSSINLSGFTNDSGFITGVDWGDIGGSQSDINISGFTNDAGYLTSVSAHGSTGYVQFNSSGSLSSSSSLFWDNSNSYLGIQTTSPWSPLHISTTTANRGAYIGWLFVGNWTGNSEHAVFAHRWHNSTANSYALRQTKDGDTLLNAASGRTLYMRVDNADLLRLTGTRFIINNGLSSSFDLRVAGGTDSNLLYTDSSTDRVGVGLDNPSEKLEVSGNVKATKFIGDGSELTGITAEDVGYSNIAYQYYHASGSIDVQSNLYTYTPGGIQCANGRGTVMPWGGSIMSVSIYISLTDDSSNDGGAHPIYPVYLRVYASNTLKVDHNISGSATSGVKKDYDTYDYDTYTFSAGDTLEVALYSSDEASSRAFTNAIISVEVAYDPSSGPY